MLYTKLTTVICGYKSDLNSRPTQPCLATCGSDAAYEAQNKIYNEWIEKNFVMIRRAGQLNEKSVRKIAESKGIVCRLKAYAHQKDTSGKGRHFHKAIIM